MAKSSFEEIQTDFSIKTRPGNQIQTEMKPNLKTKLKTKTETEFRLTSFVILFKLFVQFFTPDNRFVEHLYSADYKL